MLVLPILLGLCSFSAASMVSVEDFSQQVSNFASDFYQQCAESNAGNMVISPYSASNALVILSQAANGKSLDELYDKLHFTLDKSLNADLYSAYNSLLTRSAGAATFTSANQMYLQRGYPLKKQFQDVATDKLSSGVEVVDFSQSSQTASIINNFVEEKTNHKIKDLIDSSSLDKDSRVVIVNAVYMKAKWKSQFSKQYTHDKNFYSTETEKTSVKFMRQTAHFNYAALPDLDATVLELKYAESELSFLVILPNTRSGLSALETKLKNTNLKTILEQLHSRRVDASLPKFKIESKISLKSVLMKMGISEIFDDEKANLSGLLESTEPIVVSDVVQKAVIEIDEEGAEAAAASAIFVSQTYSAMRPLPPIIFNADHPFVYHIFDTKTKTPIFSGRLTKLENN